MEAKTLSLGCYCDGSVRTSLEVLAECEYLLKQYGVNETLQREINAYLNGDPIEDVASEIADELVYEACESLQEFCLPYTYIGYREGDFGVWVFDDINFEFDGLKVSDLAEVPDNYVGEVLHVNDHGNVSLYEANNGLVKEIWAIV